MANVMITGGAGFLGSRLARELLAGGTLDVAGAGPQPVSRLTLVDQAPVPADLAADGRVTAIRGDLAAMLAAGTASAGTASAGTASAGTASAGTASPGAGPSGTEPAGIGSSGAGWDALAGVDVIFHLAAAVSGESEADFDLGMRANLHTTELLLAACRALGTRPVVVFSSSLAVFGGSAEHPLPAEVDDDTLPNPQTSYGIQKFICEQLLADYTRKGFVRGRALRLVTVSVRPGRPNAAASGFLSGIIREPLAGERATCPVGPELEAALTSPARAVAGLLRAATATDEAWGRTGVNLPALTVSVAEMVAALERVAGPAASALIDWVPDPVVGPMMAGWPARVRSRRGERLGLTPDPDFDSVIRMHIAESGRP